VTETLTQRTLASEEYLVIGYLLDNLYLAQEVLPVVTKPVKRQKNRHREIKWPLKHLF
jgi:hypothetical protein